MVERLFDKQLIPRVLRLVNIYDIKRTARAAVIQVSSKAFGIDRTPAIIEKYLS